MSATHSRQDPVAVLIDDLYFASIVSTSAARLDMPLSFLKDGSHIPPSAPLAIVDLQFRGDWETAVREFSRTGGRVVAFGPHVDGSLMRRARAAGCSKVMAKSKFVQEVGRILESVAGRGERPWAPEVEEDRVQAGSGG